MSKALSNDQADSSAESMCAAAVVNWGSGGGAHNPFIMDGLRRELADLAVGRLDDLGVSVDAKEAVAFAVLANETLMGHAGNLPAATRAPAPAGPGQC